MEGGRAPRRSRTCAATPSNVAALRAGRGRGYAGELVAELAFDFVSWRQTSGLQHPEGHDEQSYLEEVVALAPPRATDRGRTNG